MTKLLRSHLVHWMIATIAVVPLLATPSSAVCAGDCNDDGASTVDELLVGINIALGTAAADNCRNMDSNGDNQVTVDELLAAVNVALTGCSNSPGGVGAACTSDADCSDGTCFDSLPGGYCTRIDCAVAGCPNGSTCFDTSGGGSACYKTCTTSSECRQAEGYICDQDDTCYIGSGPTPTPGAGNGRVGDPCASDDDCADGTCFDDLPGGYCTQLDCGDGGCPAGSACFDLTAGGSACYQICTLASQCRTSEGYTCDADNTCYTMAGPTPTPRPDLRPVGAACSDDIECRDAWCFGDLPGGYCTRLHCNQLGCPSGSECFDLSGDESACYQSCTSSAQCRENEGYICDAESSCYIP